MNTSLYYSLPGYGLGQSGSQIISASGQTLMTTAPLTGPAAPFVALAGAITELLGAVGIGSGCGQACITASSYANQAEALLKQNLNAYQAIPAPRALSAQQAALANFTKIWNGLVTSCAGVPGGAGQNCVSDRQAGACKWRDSNGQCWNWWIGYHDPIANDTQVVNDSVAAGATTGSSSAGPTVVAGGIDMTVVYIGAAILAGLFMVSRL